jgi:glucose-6-phosphate 1-epimerase
MSSPVVIMDRGNNTTCIINLHGSTIVSWRVNNQEQLFVSKKSVFDGRAPIRGGIPFIFPQYGDWLYGPNGPPSHGFARVTRWVLEKGPERLPTGDIEAIFSLRDSDFTFSMWQHHFRISYRIILREKELHLNVGVYNPSEKASFDFNLLLHAYFKCPDVRRCQVTGLNGVTFLDRTRMTEGPPGSPPHVPAYQECREVVTLAEMTERVYIHTPPEHIVTNVVSGRKMRIQKYNFPDTVIWNPWEQRAKEMADFGDDEHPNMICVNGGHVGQPVTLLPQQGFEASLILQVM